MSNILLIDDDENFKTAFQMEAQRKGAKLIYRKSFAGLQEVMPKHYQSITVVVLDIKCLITDDQVKEEADFIGTATKYLDENFPGFPRLILTGDDEAFDGFRKFTTKEDVYKKTPEGIKDAFEKISYYSLNSKVVKIRRQHESVFALFDLHLYDISTESTLLNIFLNIEEQDPNKFRGILSNIRALQETIYKTLNKANGDVVPDNKFMPNGMIKFNDLMKHLNGNCSDAHNNIPTSVVYQNKSVYQLADSLYWICGKYIHADINERYVISNYTIKSLIYSVMELFLWSRLYLVIN
jgi:hypothetical protein